MKFQQKLAFIIAQYSCNILPNYRYKSLTIKLLQIFHLKFLEKKRYNHYVISC